MRLESVMNCLRGRVVVNLPVPWLWRRYWVGVEDRVWTTAWDAIFMILRNGGRP